MNKIFVKSDSYSDFFSQKKNSKRGAKVYGVPLSREIASFIEDVSPESARDRLFSMFFGGNFSVVENELETELDEDLSLEGDL